MRRPLESAIRSVSALPRALQHLLMTAVRLDGLAVGLGIALGESRQPRNKNPRSAGFGGKGDLNSW